MNIYIITKARPGAPTGKTLPGYHTDRYEAETRARALQRAQHGYGFRVEELSKHRLLVNA